MGKIDNAEVRRERGKTEWTETLIHFVDGSAVMVSENVINEFPYMAGDVGFLQLDSDEGRIAVNLDNVTYMRLVDVEVADDDEE